jgi:ubiquitin-like protein Pup
MMSGQVHSEPPRKNDEDSESAQVQVTKQSHEVDDILAEIDAVLEKNAAAFVNGFVQKGGE